MSIKPTQIRNFSIIAHIDHGKSTLTDRFIELAYKDYAKELQKQDRLTDVLEIEQERGITIKLQPVTLPWKGYFLNLIDTPGHVDFAYEVSRSLKACEGAILLIDVTQGIQAQTISTLLMAMDSNLEIIPVLNKVDLADKMLINTRLDEISQILGYSPTDVILASGKTGQGATDILDAIVNKIRPPRSLEEILGQNEAKQKSISDGQTAALIFDSFYDQHKGVVASVRVFGGSIKAGQKLFLVNMSKEFIVREVGLFKPHMEQVDKLTTGMVGYIATGIKEIRDVRIGDTISNNTKVVIPGFSKPRPKVFASIFPAVDKDFIHLKEAIEKLALNDAALDVQVDNSQVLGQGFKVGFLGLLHLEITKERLFKEFSINTVITMPSVKYKVKLKTGKIIYVKGASYLPDKPLIDTIYEPVIKGEILVPDKYLNGIYELVRESRGLVESTNTLYTSATSATRSVVYYSLAVKIPYAELIKGFFNKLKAVSKGFASLQYDQVIYEPTEVVKVDILVNKQVVPSLSFLEVPNKARERAKKILNILKNTLDRQMFPIPLQGAIGSKIIARETIPAYRKNVTAKLYGGDITRKMKLWHNQAKKKKIRSQFAKVDIPHSAFIKIMQET